MFHLPTETKVENKVEPKEKTEKVNIENKVKQVISLKSEKDKEVKYNGLHAFEIVFKRTDNNKYTVKVIARTSESARNRLVNASQVSEVLSVTKLPENISKEIVEQVKVAGICKNSVKRVD